MMTLRRPLGPLVAVAILGILAAVVVSDVCNVVGSGGMVAANTELTNVQAAIDAAIADLRLPSVNARSTCNDFNSTGGCGLQGGASPVYFLYPDYLKIQTPGDSRTYSWDTTGLVSSP